MKKKWLLLLLVLLLGLSAFLFTYFYSEAKQKAIDNLNVQQSLYARQASRGIQDFFTHWTANLTILSKWRNVIDLDLTGQFALDAFYQANLGQIRGITRVDADGRIVYTTPSDPKLIGADISSQKHVLLVMHIQKPVVSDVFTAVQGYRAVALHVPVFKDGIFRGTIGITVDFQSLARRYLEGIRIGKTGYAWMISSDGTELYCPVPGHTGRSVYETSREFPSILAMATKMLRGEEGITTYSFDRIGEEQVDSVRKHAVYMPIPLGNTFWSIVVASSENEVLASLMDFRNRLILVFGLFLLGAALFLYYSLKARFIIQEEEKRQKAEAALKESEARYRELVQNANSIILRMDGSGNIIFFNEFAERFFGFSVAEVLGRNVVGTIVSPKDLSGRDLEAMIRDIKDHPDLYEDNENENMCKDGTRVWVHWTNKVMKSRERGVEILCVGQDITDRRRTEMELRESDARFRSLIEGTPEAIYVHADGKFLYLNQSAANFFGVKDARELLGTSLLERLPPQLHAMVCERIRILYEEHRSAPAIEQTMIRLDGSEISVEVNSAPIRYGDRDAAVTFARDITERRRMDQALRESEETFRKAFYTSPDSININRLSDGMYVSVNEGFTRVTGYSEAEAIGRTSIELNIWANPEDRRKLLEGLKNGGEVNNLDATFRMKNGQIRYGLMSATVIVLQGFPHILSITRDITDRKMKEERIRESTELISAIFEHVQAGIFLIDSANHRIVNANRMAAEMCGAAKEEMVGKTCHRYICPADAESCPITDCGQTVDKSERVLLTTDGKEIPVLKTAVPVRIAGRDYLLESFIDIRQEKRLASQLLQAQKMEAIGTLAGGIAHDFNNMLMGIQGIASLMMLELNPTHPQYERLKLIEDQVKSGADLTRQLLGFARGGRYEVKPTDINEIIRKSSAMFGRTRKEIAIRRKFEKEIWTLEVDQGQMEQVFLNLYVNAWQAMPAGGAIYLETQNVVLDATDHPDLPKPGRYVKISVGDSGTGMDAKTIDRIFDPFFTTKGIGKGTGLGLAMVYGIIKGHGGVIDVKSESGRGTTFEIFLPASEKAVVEEKALPVKILGGTETILLVDDEKMVLEVSREMLESLGYRVFVTGSGQEAVAVFMEKKDQIDLVILDMIMPGISGGETFDRLREIEPGIAVLFCSGYSVNHRVQEILDRGCRGFLQKPFSLEILSNRVREALSG
ncbi:MAG: PAS domain S-box protein [Deltaproteobacteria bacterium]|nr:PAS domain S-box protein [Deltaproteobacteria bacterium]